MQTRRDSANHIGSANYMAWTVDEAEKAIEAGNLEDAGVMMYNAIEMAMIQLAQGRNLPHAKQRRPYALGDGSG